MEEPSSEGEAVLGEKVNGIISRKMNPRHAGCIASYAVLLKKEKWSDLLPLIEKTGKKLDAMEIIMDYAIFADKLDLARWMFDHFKKEFPQEEDLILYYEEEFSLKQTLQKT